MVTKKIATKKATRKTQRSTKKGTRKRLMSRFPKTQKQDNIKLQAKEVNDYYNSLPNRRKCPICGGNMTKTYEVVEDEIPIGDGDNELAHTMIIGYTCLNDKCGYTLNLESFTRGTGILR